MLESVATALVLGLMAAFAVCAVLLNEGEHARRRGRRRGPAEPEAVPPALLPVLGLVEEGDSPDDRRLAVGAFLFGALYLRGHDPLPFGQLAHAAAGSGMNVAQVLTWIERAEASGLIERVMDYEQGEPGHQPAVRLTQAGMDLAGDDRRRGERAGGRQGSDAARVLGS